MVRVLIVDDQALFRAGLRALLDGHADVSVVAEAADAQLALRACERERPDVVLMDMRMPGVDGPQCTRMLLAAHPALRVIALTTFDDDETVMAAVKAGAVGYLLKDASGEELIDAIKRVAQGQSIVDPGVLGKVLGELRRVAVDGPTRVAERHGLSERELAVLLGVMSGHSNKEIAKALFIAEGTVKNHVTSIFTKLGVTDRTSAALRGRELGLDRKR